MKEESFPDPVYRGRLQEISGFHDKIESKEKKKKNRKKPAPKYIPTWDNLFFLYIKIILLRSYVPVISIKWLAFMRM